MFDIVAAARIARIWSHWHFVGGIRCVRIFRQLHPARFRGTIFVDDDKSCGFMPKLAVGYEVKIEKHRWILFLGKEA